MILELFITYWREILALVFFTLWLLSLRALIEGRPTIKAVRVPQGTVTTGRTPA